MRDPLNRGLKYGVKQVFSVVGATNRPALVDPALLRRILAGEISPSGGIGLSNVDDRLRQVYGDDYGLVIETAEGAGMKITARLPKYQPGVHPAGRLSEE